MAFKKITNPSVLRTSPLNKGDFSNLIPPLPGVYLYKDKNNKIIYIGKAINLKKRVAQYFKKTDTLGPKTQELVKNIAKIDYKIVGSEIEALVLESSLIKKHQPKYNIQLKDNKSFLYITIHKNYIETTRRTGDFGPFPSGGQVKYLLKILRRNFPFYTRPHHKKTCLYCHLGLCPKDEKENKKNINIIKKILQGKINLLFQILNFELITFKKAQNYEEAIKIRDAIKSLNYVSSGWKNISTLTEKIQLSTDLTLQSSNELELLLNIPQINRIECYDISQLGHKYFVGAMSVFQNGKIDPSSYRKFRITRVIARRSETTTKQSPSGSPRFARDDTTHANDPLMLHEIITRRLKHKEWPYPDLIVLDGGLPQLSAVMSLRGTPPVSLREGVKRRRSNPEEKGKTLSNPHRDRHTRQGGFAMTHPVFIGLTKKKETIILTNPSFVKEGNPRVSEGGRFEINLPSHSLALQLLQQLRDEAHRFANKYRRSLMKTSSKI